MTPLEVNPNGSKHELNYMKFYNLDHRFKAVDGL